MTPEFLKLKTTAGRVSVFRILAMTLPVLVSGCKITNMFAEKQYTILLHTFSGPNHVQQSKHYRDKTKELAGWKGLEVVHRDSNSELYWGKYRSIPDAESDLKTARTWRVPNVSRPAFPFPKVVLMPGAEIEKPEYNLRNAPEGLWTVLVAIFTDDPSRDVIGRDRQKHALKYCTWLRKQGYDAYYHHLPGKTQITVGTFPEDAVVAEIQASPKHDMFVTKQVIKSEKMRKIMATRDPPMHFLIVNAHMRKKDHLDPKTGKLIKTTISRTYPILIPGRTFSKRQRNRRQVPNEGQSVVP